MSAEAQIADIGQTIRPRPKMGDWKPRLKSALGHKRTFRHVRAGPGRSWQVLAGLGPVRMPLEANIIHQSHELAFQRADFLQHRQQVGEEFVRALAHREVAKSLHNGGLRTSALGNLKGAFAGAGVIVFTS